ncbi:hypothetical protein FG379_003338 [Cryptosporidium bovis]|uniref:uncharacterized protein n=1 Tax=Cryptosporidium bovis TaxID=310047 RepID=UPI00351A8699|nr:hypothetical protein FG379_003338 [Cryptosporidium bovis]
MLFILRIDNRSCTYIILLLLFILVISVFLIWLEYSGNSQTKVFGDAFQNAVKANSKVGIEDLFSPLFDLILLRVTSVFVKSVLNYISRKCIIYWRIELTERFLYSWDLIHSIEGVSQRVQEDIMRYCAILERLLIFLAQDFFILIVYFPLLSRLSLNITETWVFPNVTVNTLLSIIIINSIIGTLFVFIPSNLLTKDIIEIDKSEALFRKELVLCEVNENYDMSHFPDIYDNVDSKHRRYYNKYFALKLVQSIYSQLARISFWIFAHPSMVTPYSIGILKQTMDAFDQVSISFNFLISNFGEIVELFALHKRLSSIAKVVWGS